MSSSNTALVPDYNTSNNLNSLIVANQALTASNNAINNANSAQTTSNSAENIALNSLGTSQSALVQIPKTVSAERKISYIPTGIFTNLLTATFTIRLPNGIIQMWGNVNVTDTSGGSTIRLRLRALIGTVNYTPNIDFNLAGGGSYTIPLSASPTASGIQTGNALIDVLTVTGSVVVTSASLTVIY